MIDLDRKVREAMTRFWRVRDKQAQRQGTRTGNRDAGFRAAVTGGQHMHGFVELCRDLLVSAGLKQSEVLVQRPLEIPGYFRPEKTWDLLVIADQQLLAVIEFKAQVGPSFGSNFNNRAEEALGNATDFWAAYREGAFKPSPKPWLGYLFVLEDCDKSRAPVRLQQSHFPCFPEFLEASYAKRYEILVTKLLRERLYDGACLLYSSKPKRGLATVSFPSEELSFRQFVSGLLGHAHAVSQLREMR